MYEAFFHFRQRPFLAAPSASRYFPTDAIEHARQSLIRCVERAEGPALIVGPSGTGKTLLCQLVAEHFRAKFQVALLANTQLCSRRALLQSILFELGLPYRDLEEGELRLSLIDSLTPERSGSQGLVLIFDEAHTLPLRLLEEIRMITNLVRNGQPRVRLILAGGPKLEERFTSPKLETFNQRLAVRCYLQPLNREETAHYVRSQINAVGGNAEQVFDAAAQRAIFTATDGVPRLINQVCDYALLLASVANQSPVSSQIIEEAWADLQQLPGPWSTTESSAASSSDTTSIIEFGQLDDLPASPPFAPHPTVAPVAAHEAHTFGVGANFTPALESNPYGTEQQFDQIANNMAEIYAAEFPTYDPLDHSNDVQTCGPFHVVEPDTSVPTNPFGDGFAEEEVIIDRYAMLEDKVLKGRPRVSSIEGRDLAAALAAQAESLRGVAERPRLAIAAHTCDPHEEETTAGNAAPSAEDEEVLMIDDIVIRVPKKRQETSATDSFSESFVAAADGDFVWPPVAPHEDGITTHNAAPPFAAEATNAETLGAFRAAPVKIKSVPADDRDILLIDEPSSSTPTDSSVNPNEAVGHARRQEYRQLFAKLRRGAV